MTVQQPNFGQTTTEAAKDDFDKFVQRAADSDGDESVYSADLGRQESGALITTLQISVVLCHAFRQKCVVRLNILMVHQASL